MANASIEIRVFEKTKQVIRARERERLYSLKSSSSVVKDFGVKAKCRPFKIFHQQESFCIAVKTHVLKPT